MATEKPNLIFIVRQVEVLDYFVRQLAAAADARGVSYYMVDLSRPETIRSPQFIDFLHRGNCALFLINQRTGMATWNALGIPIYNLLVDHPRIFYEILEAPMEQLRPIVLDRNHEAYIRECYPNVKTVHFMPLGGTAQEPILPYAKRDIDILYTGNCQTLPERYPGFSFLKNNGQDLYQYCIPAQIDQPHLTAEAVVKQYFDEGRERKPEDIAQFREVLRLCAWKVEDVARRHYKQQIMQALDKAGVSVEVYGENWEDEAYTYGEHIHFHARVSSAECNRLAGRAKISLNIMPWFKDGCSERVFNNMLNGAVCLTDPSDYLLERFTDRKELVFFDMTDTDGLVEKIRDLLAHPDEAAQIAKRGQACALANDTWANRFDTLVQMIEADLETF